MNVRHAILVIPLLLVACSTSSSQTPAGSATDGPSPVPSASAGSAAPSPDTAATPGPSLGGDLESLLPREIAGNEMTIEPASDPANSFMILWNDAQTAQDLLDALGGSADDIDVVFSYAKGNTSPNRVSVDAYRVAGADGTALRDGFVQNYSDFFKLVTTVEVTDETVGGKRVVRLDMTETPDGQEQHFYSVGDTVFVVSGTPIEWVEDALSQLP